MVRLLQKVRTFAQREVTADHFGAVPAGVDDFELWLFSSQGFGQFTPGHTVGHAHIREQKVNVRLTLSPQFDGSDARGRFQNMIALTLKKTGHERTHGRFVFNDEDGFGATADSHLEGFAFGWRCFLGLMRQKDLEGRAFAEFTGHFDPSMMLLNDAVHGGETQARSFANLLGREERLEYAVQVFGSNPATRI